MLSRFVNGERKSQSDSVVTNSAIAGALIDRKQRGKYPFTVVRNRGTKTLGRKHDEPRRHRGLPNHELQLKGQSWEQHELAERLFSLSRRSPRRRRDASIVLLASRDHGEVL